MVACNQTKHVDQKGERAPQIKIILINLDHVLGLGLCRCRYLDLLVGSVGEVGERPARVGQDVRVFVEEESGQHL